MDHPFTNAQELEANWLLDERFGALNVEFFPWVYSLTNGWWFVDTEIEANKLWIYDLQLGWLRTDINTFPYAWSLDRGNAVYIHSPSPDTRWVYDFGPGEWESVEGSM